MLRRYIIGYLSTCLFALSQPRIQACHPVLHRTGGKTNMQLCPINNLKPVIRETQYKIHCRRGICDVMQSRLIKLKGCIVNTKVPKRAVVIDQNQTWLEIFISKTYQLFLATKPTPNVRRRLQKLSDMKAEERFCTRPAKKRL